MRWWFSRSFKKAFHCPIQILTSYLFLWNYLLVLKMLTKTIPRVTFSVICQCSLVPTSHWLQRKCARINLSQAASMILQNNMRLPESIFSVKIAALGSFKRTTGRILKISKLLQRSQLKLWEWFFSSTKKKSCKNFSACTESTYLL